jgi:hypothetical protein
MKTINLYPGEGLDLDFEFGRDVSTWTIGGELLAGGISVATLSVTRPTITSARVTTTGPQSRAVEGRQVIVRCNATDPTRPTVPVVEEVRVNVALESSSTPLPAVVNAHVTGTILVDGAATFVGPVTVGGVLTATSLAADVSLSPVTATGTTTARTLAARNADHLNILDFGADPTGVSDSAAAIQACIDAAMTAGDPAVVARSGIKAVYIPTGTYRVNSTIKVKGVNFFTMYGDGAASVLAAGAPISGAVLEINGVAYSSFSGFRIGYVGAEATNTFWYGIWVRWDQANVVRSTQLLNFRDITVTGGKWVYAYYVGEDSTYQVSETYWSGCIATGLWTAGDTTWWQAAFKIGSGYFGSNLNHTIISPKTYQTRYAIHVDASNCFQFGGMLQISEVDLKLSNIAQVCRFGGFRSEASGRLLEAAFSSNVKGIHVTDVDWGTTGLNADDNAVYINVPGPLILTNVQFMGSVASRTPYIKSENVLGTLIMDGCGFGGDVDAGNAIYRVLGTASVRGISRLDDLTEVKGIEGGFYAKNGPIVSGRQAITYSASMTPDATKGNWHIITATDGNAFTINAPTVRYINDGQRITITLINTSGGALGIATWNVIYVMTAWTSPATGKSRSIDFAYNAGVGNWVEVGRTAADV